MARPRVWIHLDVAVGVIDGERRPAPNPVRIMGRSDLAVNLVLDEAAGADDNVLLSEREHGNREVILLCEMSGGGIIGIAEKIKGNTYARRPPLSS